MSSDEKKRRVKAIFNGRDHLNGKSRRELEEMGIRVEVTSNHIKLRVNGWLFICSKTPGDSRGGKNLAARICRVL